MRLNKCRGFIENGLTIGKLIIIREGLAYKREVLSKRVKLNKGFMVGN